MPIAHFFCYFYFRKTNTFTTFHYFVSCEIMIISVVNYTFFIPWNNSVLAVFFWIIEFMCPYCY